METRLEERIRADADALPPLPLDSSDVWSVIRHRRAARKRRRAIVGGAVAAFTAAVLITSPWSVATPNEMGPAGVPGSSECDGACITAEEESLLHAQETVLGFTERVHAVADGNEDFGGLGIGTAPLIIEVTWHGTVPPEVASILSEAEGAGIIVEYVSAPYRLAELEEATSALNAALGERGIQVLTVGPSPGLSGITVGSTALLEDPEAQSRVRELAREVIGDIPVAFIPGDAPTGLESHLVPDLAEEYREALEGS